MLIVELARFAQEQRRYTTTKARYNELDALLFLSKHVGNTGSGRNGVGPQSLIDPMAEFLLVEKLLEGPTARQDSVRVLLGFAERPRVH